MSLQRRKRLEYLEAIVRRRRPETPYIDPFEVAQALLQRIEVDAVAVRKGLAEWISVYGPDPEPSPAMVAALAYFDQLAAEAELRVQVSYSIPLRGGGPHPTLR